MPKSTELQFVELQVEAKFLKKRIKELEVEKQELTTRLDRSYDALTAKESPVAYADQKAEEFAAKYPDLAEKRKQKANEAEITNLLMREQENPIFKSADDMEALLTRPLKQVKSKPGNYEEES